MAPSATRAAVAAPVVLERGHIDLVEVSLAGDKLVVSARDHTAAGGPTFRSPSDLQIRVPDRARLQVPAGDSFSFLGAPGSPLYLLPQTEDRELVWPGWSTERLRPGDVAGDQVTWHLRSVDGPGAFSLFTVNQFGTPSIVLDGRAPGNSSTHVRINTHAHANWAFSAPGVYRIGVEVEAIVDGARRAARATYVFLVGDATAPVQSGDGGSTSTTTEVPPAAPGVPSPSGDPTVDSEGGTLSVPGASAADNGSTASVGTEVEGRVQTSSDASGIEASAGASLPATGTDPRRGLVIGIVLILSGIALTATRRVGARPLR